MTSTGVRNNNPFNVKKPGSDVWVGTVAYDERGHVIFSDPAYGVRAVLRDLMNKEKAGLKCLYDIFERYAPISDTQGSIQGRPANDPQGYAEYVAGKMGVAPSETLDLFEGSNPTDWPKLCKMLKAMGRMENGSLWVIDNDVLNRGLIYFLTI